MMHRFKNTSIIERIISGSYPISICRYKIEYGLDLQNNRKEIDDFRNHKANKIELLPRNKDSILVFIRTITSVFFIESGPFSSLETRLLTE